jgi:GWxTD domain-containing protein
MRNKKYLLLFGFLFLLPLLSAQQKMKEKDLPEQYRDWLNLVQYIILPKEKDVFLRLTSGRDRDVFIETFWKQRDPTPGTPQNEYKDEHIRRFLYANKFYGRGTTRPGWQTDMGRFYIILGAPVSIERFETSSWVVPCQAWSYYGDPSKDLPTHFSLLFFKRGGIGEYKLYDPSADGPAALLVNKKDVDATDYLELYEKIKEIAPTLADLSISIVPGEYNYDYTPTPQNNIIMANIYESPKKDINPSYATHFLNYKGIVSTEYMTNYIDSEADVSLIDDPVTGISFAHFAMVPKSITLEEYEPKNQWFCDYRVDVSLRVGETIVFQYNKEFPVYVTEEEARRIQANGISIEDSFPAVPGKYRLTILLQNSVGKEFSLCERDIVVPEEGGKPKIQGPFLGYKLETYGSQVHIPYKALDKKLVIDPKDTFSSSEDLAVLLNVLNAGEEIWKTGEVRIQIKGLRDVNPSQKSFVLKLNAANYSKIINLASSLPLSELIPDYYEIKTALVDSAGTVQDESSANFIISPESAVPHPIARAKGFPLSSLYLYRHMLARQYDKLSLNDRAEAEYRRVFELAPEYKEGVVDYVSFLLKAGKFDQALEVNEKLKDAEKFTFDYFYLRGKSQMGLGKYGEAVDSFLEGNKIYNSDIRLLNSLGFCYYRIGEKKKALDTLGASLRLNPKQEEIKKLVAEIGRS